MRVTDLNFQYPSELIATVPKEPCRILLSSPSEAPRELLRSQLFHLFRPGDVLVRNNTRVTKRRIFLSDGLEILFVRPFSENEWEVLFPARDLPVGSQLVLPGGRTLTLQAKGLPQRATVSESLTEDYFAEFGEVALPPYIQKARGERKPRVEDQGWYQTEWAKDPGSSAAPTASLHFRESDFQDLKSFGVRVEELTLHVGLGTFLPIKMDRLEDHHMHSEWISIPSQTLEGLKAAQNEGKRIWALGTTVARALESWGLGLLAPREGGGVQGESEIFIRPGYEWTTVNALITNFHQPQSTLLALVAAFAGLERTLDVYRFAVEERFRLFSYGDVSVWLKR